MKTTKNDSGIFVVIDYSAREHDTILKASKPTKLHYSYSNALLEASRLATQNPGRDFAVFRCNGFTKAAIQEPDFRMPNQGDVDDLHNDDVPF